MPCVIALAVFVIVWTAAPASAQVVVATGVAEDATEANSQPKIASDKSGKVYLTFVKPVGGYSQIFVASSADGRRWAVEQVSRASAHAKYPALAVDARGTVHMVWYGIRAGAPVVTTRHGSLYEILYTSTSGGRLRPVTNGAGWTPPAVISPGIPDSINPALVIDQTGRLHSAWYQFDLRNYQVRHTVADRGIWMRPETISSGRADSMAVALAAGPSGTVLVIWERRDPDGSRIDFAERTQRWSGQQQLSPPAQRGFNPSVTADARGRVYAAWDSAGQIYLRRRNGAWEDTERVTNQPENARPIVAAAGRSVLLMWTQQSGDESRLRLMPVADAGAPVLRSRLPWGLVAGGAVVAGLFIIWTVLRQRRSRGVA